MVPDDVRGARGSRTGDSRDPTAEPAPDDVAGSDAPPHVRTDDAFAATIAPPAALGTHAPPRPIDPSDPIDPIASQAEPDSPTASQVQTQRNSNRQPAMSALESG